MYACIPSGVIFIILAIMAITDKGDYRKAGPRSLYFLFLMLWVIGFLTGLSI